MCCLIIILFASFLPRRSGFCEIRIIQPEGECCPACCRCAHTNSGSAQAAVLYPLIGTCRLNNTELKKWLRYVIEHIQDWPANRVRDLLPWEVELTAQ